MSARIRIATPEGRQAIVTRAVAVNFIMRRTGCCRTIAQVRLRAHPLDAFKLYAPVDPVHSENGRMAHP